MTPFHPLAEVPPHLRNWPTWKADLERLGVVVPPAELGAFEGLEKFPAVRLVVRASLPADGPVYDVRAEEVIYVVLPERFPRTPPLVLAGRDDFPRVPHLMRHCERMGLYELCLTRQPLADWWVGQTLPDVALRIARWLDDAAAGLLVKDTDPYEPLWLPDPAGIIEFDGEVARARSVEHGGIWATAAAVDEANPRRMIVGEGKLSAVVFYQAAEQATPWVAPPGTLDEVAEMAADIGLDREKVRYWIEARNQDADAVAVLLGARRTKEVLGQAGQDEWVGFVLRRSQHGRNRGRANRRWGEWQVQTFGVRERLTPALAARLGGWGETTSPRSVLVIGAGALGSHLCEALARSGLARLTIVDPDILAPHNLVRHTLDGSDVGRNKAEALAAKLNSLFPSHPIVEAIPANLLDLDAEQLAERIRGRICILDCSASLAVQVTLSDLQRPCPPVVTVFQVDAGRGTVILRAPAAEGPGVTPEVLEAVMVSRYRDHLAVDAWLHEQVEPIQIGGGCRSASARIPDSLIRQGAAWAADTLLRWFVLTDWPAGAGYAVRADRFDEVSRADITWNPVGAGRWVEACNWRVWLAAGVAEEVARHARVTDRETGGLLLGQVDRQRHVMVLTDAWGPPPDSAGSRAGFTRGVDGLGARLAALEADTAGRIRYAGEWHSHPRMASTAMSGTDRATMLKNTQLLGPERLPAICLITNGDRLDLHVIESLESAP